MLGAYLVCAALLQVFGVPNPAPLQAHAQLPGLAALLWFARAHAADALLLNAVLLAVRPMIPVFQITSFSPCLGCWT